MDAFVYGTLENDGSIFGEGVKGFLVVEGKRWDHDANADLKATAGTPFGIETIGKFPEEITDGS